MEKFERDEDKDFDPADLKKKTAFDLLDEEEVDSVDKIDLDTDVDEEEEGLALYEADTDDAGEIYSF